jgi:hypothetical protein
LVAVGGTGVAVGGAEVGVGVGVGAGAHAASTNGATIIIAIKRIGFIFSSLENTIVPFN